MCCATTQVATRQRRHDLWAIPLEMEISFLDHASIQSSEHRTPTNHNPDQQLDLTHRQVSRRTDLTPGKPLTTSDNSGSLRFELAIAESQIFAQRRVHLDRLTTIGHIISE